MIRNFRKTILIILTGLCINIGFAKNNNDEICKELINSARDISAFYPDSALIILEKAEKVCKETSNKAIIAELYRRKANCYFFKAEYTKAKELYFEALSIRMSNYFSENDIDNKSEIGNLYYNLAIIFQNLEDYSQALQYSLKLEALYIEINDLANLGFRSYNLSAKLYYHLGDLINAQKFAYKELKIMETLQDQVSISFVKDFLAMLKQEQNDLDEALNLQIESFEIRKEMNDSVLLSYSYNNIGTTYLFLKEFEKAIEFFNESLKIKLKYNDEINIPATYNNLGLAYQGLKDYNQSKENFYKSYTYSKNKNSNYEIVTAAINLGNIYFINRDYKQSEKYQREAFDIAVKNGYKNHIISASQNLAEFYQNQGDYKTAFYMLKLNSDYKDSVKNEDVIKELTRMEVEFEFKQIQISDSIRIQQELNTRDMIYREEIKRKEQTLRYFIIISVFIFILVIVLFKAYQLKRKNKENELKKRSVEIEKDLMRSQMNPHFIFNAMNSIQSFIALNDTYSAERYLSKFAQLIRYILENTMHKRISLNSELKSLELYMELERLRFNNKFDYQINIDKNIDDEFIYIPPMLIQPFVENSILHGIMHKEGKGQIVLNICECPQSNCIKCEIIDDGIGRKASAKINLKQGKKHKSVGMQLTRERLTTLNSETKDFTNFSVIDIIKENEIKGTKVELIIPYYDNEK